jgi:hypothetical protein
MKKNSFLARMEAQKEAEKIQILRFTRQVIMDCMAIALNDVCGFGAKRIKEDMDAVAENYCEYADMINADTADQEYSWATLDRKLQQICGEYFVPWEERYGQ